VIQGESGYSGVNYKGAITIYEAALNRGTDSYLQTIFHEIGHNHDTESPNFDQFMAISGWTGADPNSSSYTKGIDNKEDWWHLKTADFARYYGQTNPREDFATAFGAYFIDYLGLAYDGTNTGTSLAGADAIDGSGGKMQYLDAYFDSFSPSQPRFIGGASNRVVRLSK
jgi:hypothetical protein